MPESVPLMAARMSILYSLFLVNLFPQKVSAEIRRRTGHLPGVKIAVMGCIVNGIGEMGDADFGYVGGAPGLVR